MGTRRALSVQRIKVLNVVILAPLSAWLHKIHVNKTRQEKSCKEYNRVCHNSVTRIM
jgi:hypothetical protein